VSRAALLIWRRDEVCKMQMVLIAKRRSSMFKNKKFACALLLTTFVTASVATMAFAAGSTEPPQIPGYDSHGRTVPIPNPDRS
jgi:hypothetical protein